MSTKILLVDDHPIMVEGLQALLAQIPGFVVVGEATSGKDALRLVSERSPDMVVMGIQMRDMDGIEITRQITAQMPKVKVIALSMHSNKFFVLNMLKAGAKGYLLKKSAFKEIVQALQAIEKGEMYVSPKVAGYLVDYPPQSPAAGEPQSEKLTDRELEILKLISDGKSTKEIALKIDMSTKTVDAERRMIMKKVKLDNLAGLIKYAIREGLTSYEMKPLAIG